MISIEATQTFFSGLGIAFCILSFIAVFIPSKTKFGIISLCLGNVPLWSAIVMPKSLAPVMDLFQVNQSANLFVAGCIAGAVCLVLWYFVTSKIMVFIRQNFRSDSKDKTEHSESSEVSGNGEDASENTFSDTKSESANPHLFDNLKVNDKE